ncbi:MAG: hypothetical protein ACREP6_05090 [Candidatus Binataceae bacterium]
MAGPIKITCMREENDVGEAQILVVGIGEVGGALARLIERRTPVLRHDLEPRDFDGPIGVMHLCIPFRTAAEFEESALSYIARFNPALTIINSTVLPGMTRKVAERSGAAVAFSPVRGKHIRMIEDMTRYVKFVAAPDDAAAAHAEEHFRSVGMKTRRMSRVETLELAKISETSYFGVLIGFAQELNRFAERVGGDYFEAVEFFQEIDFLPGARYFPGIIGGHCVIPNLHLMLQVGPSALFEAILESNDLRVCEIDGPAAEKSGQAKKKGTLDEGKLLADS